MPEAEITKAVQILPTDRYFKASQGCEIAKSRVGFATLHHGFRCQPRIGERRTCTKSQLAPNRRQP
jgi:hypothetical protein